MSNKIYHSWNLEKKDNKLSFSHSVSSNNNHKLNLMDRLLKNNGKMSLAIGLASLAVVVALSFTGVGFIGILPSALLAGYTVGSSINTMLNNKELKKEPDKLESIVANQIERINSELNKKGGRDITKANEISKEDVAIAKNVLEKFENEIRNDDPSGIKKVASGIVKMMLTKASEKINLAPSIDSKPENKDNQREVKGMDRSSKSNNSREKKSKEDCTREAAQLKEKMLHQKNTRTNGLGRS